jgi:hypothetical protein
MAEIHYPPRRKRAIGRACLYRKNEREISLQPLMDGRKQLLNV